MPEFLKRPRTLGALCEKALLDKNLWELLENLYCEWWKKDGKNRRSDGPTDEKSDDSGNVSLPTAPGSSTSSQQGQTQQGSSTQLEQKFACYWDRCGKQFSYPCNRRRHYKTVHKEYLCDILGCLSTFKDTNELDDHQEKPHPCPNPNCRKLFKGNISLGTARKHLNHHLRSSTTEAELDGTFRPNFNSTRIDDDSIFCCNLRHRTLGPTLELAINAEEKHGISLMALIFSFVFGPENIYCSTQHIHSIARYGKLYSSCSIRRVELTQSDLPSTLILDDPSLKTSVSVDLMKEIRGKFGKTSFGSCFQQLCILGNNYGIFTINQVPIAVVLTNDKLYAFNVDAVKDDGSISGLRVCMQSHPRSECLEAFLYEYLQSTRDQTGSNNWSIISHTEDSLEPNFSFKIISLRY